MKASKTLLASLLKRGRHIGKCKFDRNRSSIPNRNLSYFVRNKREMIGKLIGVEIEYYPLEKIKMRSNLEILDDDASLDIGGGANSNV